ncbi:MAG: VWA domain-containing protein [Proteobacteria bacterium]|nr:VWA domain-containing protein [Pseudomonadota bacterium]
MGVSFSFSNPGYLWLLPLVLLPFIGSLLESRSYSWTDIIPAKRSGHILDRVLIAIALLAIISLVLGAAGLYLPEQSIERTGKGAHTFFVLDRSGSMNQTFAGKTPDGENESKANAAQRLLDEFILKRPRDHFGVVGFSTQPLFVLPLSDHRSAVSAAFAALNTPGLAFTNVAKGLGMALEQFRDQPYSGARVIMLVSDGAATLDHRAQKTLRSWFREYRVSLYWLFLRTENSPGIYDKPEDPRDDNPRTMPERYLHDFFKSLGVPYKAYEVENPEALREAIKDLSSLENRPVLYTEKIQQKPLDRWCFVLAFIALSFLTFIKYMEVEW